MTRETLVMLIALSQQRGPGGIVREHIGLQEIDEDRRLKRMGYPMAFPNLAGAPQKRRSIFRKLESKQPTNNFLHEEILSG